MDMKIFRHEMSNLKKKLLLYFIIISAVSFSISAEMLLEMSSPRFQRNMTEIYYHQLRISGYEDIIPMMTATLDIDKIFTPLSQMRQRILLLMIFIAACIVAGFSLFIKEIIAPLEDIVQATKKMADGDLTVRVPIKTNYEIGQIGTMLNTVNLGLVQLLIQLKYELGQQSTELTNFIDTTYISSLIQNRASTENTPASRIDEIAELKQREKHIAAAMEGQLARITKLKNYLDSYDVTNTAG
jgi:methyl-accepting chemotaxis protein